LRTKLLPAIVLSSEMYARLERQARAHERDAVQEARWLLKQALTPTDRADASSAVERRA
jgi:plasmid stability protein